MLFKNSAYFPRMGSHNCRWGIPKIKIREENKSETSLPQNASEVITGDINIQDLIGKVIEGEISESYGLQKTLIKMMKNLKSRNEK